MENRFTKSCIDVLKREDVRTELKNVMKPLIDIILINIYPYIYISLIVVVISFILHLGIFILLLRKN
uniref:Uncharacterized protein n=1 Tax=viral metagenome TaxID=1070528 RepID=A0A6C0JV18_9ZZZZ